MYNNNNHQANIESLIQNINNQVPYITYDTFSENIDFLKNIKANIQNTLNQISGTPLGDKVLQKQCINAAHVYKEKIDQIQSLHLTTISDHSNYLKRLISDLKNEMQNKEPNVKNCQQKFNVLRKAIEQFVKILKNNQVLIYDLHLQIDDQLYSMCQSNLELYANFIKEVNQLNQTFESILHSQKSYNLHSQKSYNDITPQMFNLNQSTNNHHQQYNDSIDEITQRFNGIKFEVDNLLKYTFLNERQHFWALIQVQTHKEMLLDLLKENNISHLQSMAAEETLQQLQSYEAQYLQLESQKSGNQYYQSQIQQYHDGSQQQSQYYQSQSQYYGSQQQQLESAKSSSIFNKASGYNSTHQSPQSQYHDGSQQQSQYYDGSQPQQLKSAKSSSIFNKASGYNSTHQSIQYFENKIANIKQQHNVASCAEICTLLQDYQSQLQLFLKNNNLSRDDVKHVHQIMKEIHSYKAFIRKTYNMDPDGCQRIVDTLSCIISCLRDACRKLWKQPKIMSRAEIMQQSDKIFNQSILF